MTFTLRVVREDEEVDTGGPSSRAEDGDPLRVSAKVAYVLVEPTQSLDLVQQAIVPLSRLISGAQEALCVGHKDGGRSVFRRARGGWRGMKREQDKMLLGSVALIFSICQESDSHFGL